MKFDVDGVSFEGTPAEFMLFLDNIKTVSEGKKTRTKRTESKRAATFKALDAFISARKEFYTYQIVECLPECVEPAIGMAYFYDWRNNTKRIKCVSKGHYKVTKG